MQMLLEFWKISKISCYIEEYWDSRNLTPIATSGYDRYNRTSKTNRKGFNYNSVSQNKYFWIQVTLFLGQKLYKIPA